MIAVNWSTQEDMTNMFWRQNISQMWVETEFKVSKDAASWRTLSEAEQDTFRKVLVGLTDLDTHQADNGMPLVMLHTTDLRKKIVYSFMAMTKRIHTKNYLHTSTTLLPSNETSYLLDEWVLEEPHLKYKSDKIITNYHKLWGKEASIYDQHMARVTSVFLKTFLFFSGFYYLLYLVGQGKVTTLSGIIRKIFLGESIHDVFTGLDAQHLRSKLSESEKQEVGQEMYKLLNDLYLNEESYTKMSYGDLGIAEDVLNYVGYDENRTLSGLGFEPYFEEREFDPTIENALNTTTKDHDFFSVKGDGHILALNMEVLQGDDFIFDSE